MFQQEHHTPGGVRLSLKPGSDPLLMHLHLLAASDDYDQLRNGIGGYMVANVQDCFDEQKLWDGTTMPASAASAGRGDKDTTGKTLIDNRFLYDSYTYALVGDGVDVGSNLIYARIHHLGGMAGRGHKTHIIPRPVLGMTDEQNEHIGGMIIADLMELERRLPS